MLPSLEYHACRSCARPLVITSLDQIHAADHGKLPPGMTPKAPPDAGTGALRAGFGVAHFGVHTTDLDSVLARLREAAVHVHAEPRRAGSIRCSTA